MWTETPYSKQHGPPLPNPGSSACSKTSSREYPYSSTASDATSFNPRLSKLFAN